MSEQIEAFPQTPEEIRLARMAKIQVKLTEDVDKADTAINNAVEKHRIALILLNDCESVIKELADILASGADPHTGEVS
jgi:hypothetical protein